MHRNSSSSGRTVEGSTAPSGDGRACVGWHEVRTMGLAPSLLSDARDVVGSAVVLVGGVNGVKVEVKLEVEAVFEE